MTTSHDHFVSAPPMPALGALVISYQSPDFVVTVDPPTLPAFLTPDEALRLSAWLRTKVAQR